MFENLRDAFREAIANFKEELHRDEVPGTVDRLLAGMQGEVADAKATLRTLHRQLEQTRSQVLRESAEEVTCRRREDMAHRVGDDETARLAVEYAARHARRREVLERKAHALDEEHAMRASELAEMLARVREAQEKRDELAASAGGDQARNARVADDLYDELDRMANAIGDAESGPRGRTTEDLDREYADLRVDPWAPVEPRRVDYDARLSELKRRMQSE